MRLTGDSLPPATITSASPSATIRAASPMAWAPVEQAVTTAWLGPLRPNSMETKPDARLMMRPGIKNGHPARTFFMQIDRRLGDALDAANAGADQHAGHGLIFVTGRPPAGVVERLARRAHGIDDELIDLALLLGLHPLVGIEGGVAAVAARHAASDLAGDVGDVEA